MSRASTATAPQTGKPAQTTAAVPQQMLQSPQTGVPLEKVAERAYQKWLKGGCKHGNDKKDWLEAEMELKAELARGKK
jgi:hypothetical protein